MAKKLLHETPLYCLDTFSTTDHSFYMERLQDHLKNRDFLSKPHKHNFYLLLYIKHGGGEHTIDFRAHEIKAGRFFLMTPGQVHSWKLHEDTDGYIIFFVQDFYRMQQHENSLVEFPFFHTLNANPVIDVHDSTISNTLKEMYDEYKRTSSVLDLRMLRTYLELLLLKLARMYPLQTQKVSEATTTAKLRKLEQYIEKHYAKLKQAGEYADLMNLSPSYLNAICKQNLDKTLSDLIHERVILEAKRLFAYADVTVNQVSNKLNFSAPSYFIRFFRKHTGLTPEQFKETLNRAIQ